MYLLVDPIVLHLPEAAATSDQINYFFTNLYNWNKFIRTNEGNHTFCMTQVCRLALGAEYPSRNSLQSLITRADNCVFDAHTGYGACQYLLQAFAGWPLFEQMIALPLDAFAFDDEDMSLAPDLVGRVPTEIAESLQETFAYVAYAKEIDNNPIAADLLFLTQPVKNSDKIEIDVHLLIDDSEVDDSDEWQHAQTDLAIVGTPEDLLRRSDLTDIWEDTRAAIDWQIIKYRTNGTIKEDTQLSRYTVGPEFNDSLQDCHFPTHDNRLKRCFEKIAQLLTGNIWNYDELRTGPNANDPQRTKTVADRVWSAWRLYITGGGNAFRLHYWYSEGEYILSNVVTHDNFNICTINKHIITQIQRDV